MSCVSSKLILVDAASQPRVPSPRPRGHAKEHLARYLGLISLGLDPAHLLVKSNKGNIVTALRNDKTFRTVFAQYDLKYLRGTPMVHHHVGGGSIAAAVPAPLHPGSGGIHIVEKDLGIIFQ
ncbi:hypothetical protein [Bremerella sp.]|uniref:hypothetical protein n=1 Tax=Bremerella sp. TaxID=2795602 RepID=UPI00391D9E4B